jgi:hypothetical protein
MVDNMLELILKSFKHTTHAVYIPGLILECGIYEIHNPNVKYIIMTPLKTPKYNTEIGLTLYVGVQEAPKRKE